MLRQCLGSQKESPTSSYPIVLTYRKETNINSASRPASPPSIKEFTSSVRPNIGSIPVGYRIMAKTKKTISPIIKLKIPPTTELTVDDRSAMLFLLDLVHKKNGDYFPRFMVCVVSVSTNIFIELAKFKHISVYF
ncbi:MAG: hypothetical protein VX284_01170, partial [Candidatus Neomarinimicrobiota bacterium]|nr:hypothetical protein [Candidatus Neomarinimicrobiota bacterium]